MDEESAPISNAEILIAAPIYPPWLAAGQMCNGDLEKDTASCLHARLCTDIEGHFACSFEPRERKYSMALLFPGIKLAGPSQKAIERPEVLLGLAGKVFGISGSRKGHSETHVFSMVGNDVKMVKNETGIVISATWRHDPLGDSMQIAVVQPRKVP
jgi:hypothetical protein